MGFNSAEFLFCFLPLTLAGFLVFGRFGRTAVIAWLGIASLVFYAYWRPAFLLLLMGSIAVNYVCAALIWRNRTRPTLQKALLILGVSANLAALASFKYLFPLLHWLNAALGLHYAIGDVSLPLGISFFTFTQIAYLVDLSQDAAEPQDVPGYILFVTCFPYIIAGPIVHHREIMPQFSADRTFRIRGNDFSVGLSWFILGLCKKVLIADHLAPHANAVFAHPAGLSTADAWIGVLNYALQLYFDFSGYSDMAVGVARMFSITLPLNFNSPYKAASIIEFWSRWHMTLTRYLTLYLYNPMAMWVSRRRAAAGRPTSRKAARTLPGFASMVVFPTMTTMFLAGIWHGAGLQFIIFGLLHGTYIGLNHAWRIFRKEGSLLAHFLQLRPVGIALTFVCVLVAQVFFRAASTHDALTVLAALSGFGGGGFAPVRIHTAHAYVVFLLLPVVWLLPNTQEILGQVPLSPTASILRSWVPVMQWRPTFAWAVALGAALVAVLWNMADTSTFLYFQF